MGSYAGFSGESQTRWASRLKRLTVTSSSIRANNDPVHCGLPVCGEPPAGHHPGSPHRAYSCRVPVTGNRDVERTYSGQAGICFQYSARPGWDCPPPRCQPVAMECAAVQHREAALWPVPSGQYHASGDAPICSISFFSSARKWLCAAFGERNPKCADMSFLVGGYPCLSI